MKYLIPIIIALSICSCSGYLDKEPEKSLPFKDMDYTRTQDMFQPVSGAYSYFNYYITTWKVASVTHVRSDDTDKGSSPTDQIEIQYIDDLKYNTIKDAWILNEAWLNLHQIVITINEALESLELYKVHIKKAEDTRLYEQYNAELRFLRAYTYVFITNLWGEVPLITNNEQLKKNPPKVSLTGLRKFIEEELLYASTKLPKIHPNQSEHKGAPTYYSALGVLAKLYLYDQKYDKVKSTTELIINSNLFELYPDYYQLFKIPGKLSNETLYEAQFSDLGNSSGEMVWTDFWHSFQGPRGNEGTITGWGLMIPSKKLIAALNTRGETVRKKTLLLPANAKTPEGDSIGPNDLKIDYWAGKAYTPLSQMTPGRDWYGDNNNVRMLRYADILLMHAESKVRLGENGDESLKLVRTRAQMPQITNATLDQILEERRIELAMEWGERYFDLVRTGKAVQELNNFVVGVSEFLPIPQRQVDLNSSLR